MTLLVDIAHMLLATILSFLGLGYERAVDPHAVQISPSELREELEGALLSPATLSVPMQNAQSLCSPGFVMQATLPTSEARAPQATTQIIILNDCETIPNRRALPTL